jgi:pyruvate kinase
VLLDDGLIYLQVEKVDQSDVLCKVIIGGILSENKGINLPGNKLSVAPLTKKDIENLTFGIRHNVDYIALSFVQNAEDVKQLKEKISELESDIPVIAKIEKPQAVECINEIVSIADAIMIARGDLGVELSAEKVPPIQKQIINLCNKRGIPVITATQMLDSMIHNPRPTRAEASDVANAVLDGSDAVMLSGETATGKYPIDAVKMMDKIINLIENDKKLKNSINLHKLQEEIYSPPLAIGHAACSAAQLLNAKAIVCLTQSGSTARIISRFRPENSIIAITSKDTTLLRLSLIWGVNAHSVGDFKNNIDDAISDIKKILLTKTAIEKGDIIVITAGLPFRKKRKTNMLRIEEV